MKTMNSFVPGRYILVKYPLHGKGNILKYHSGVIEETRISQKGNIYCKVKCDDGTYRNLRVDRMIDPEISK